jgi:hypothetical protein
MTAASCGRDEIGPEREKDRPDGAGNGGSEVYAVHPDQQEVLLNTADIIMEAYQMESAVLRAKKAAGPERRGSRERFTDMAAVYCNDAIQRIEMKARNTLAAVAEGDEGRRCWSR